MYVYANGFEFINFYYVGPESTDINSEQAQQESASILNVLRALTPADKPKVWSVPMFLIIHV